MISEALLDGQSEALTNKAIERALGGDSAMMRLMMERILSPRRERPLHFKLPLLKTAADAMVAIAKIVKGVAQGELSDSEARTLTGVVDTFLKALAQIDDDRRLTELEGRIFKFEENKAATEKPLGTFRRPWSVE